jgi:tetratricopeptide (TPR) repeat protein
MRSLSFKKKPAPGAKERDRCKDKKTFSELSKLMAYILRHDKKNEFYVDLDNHCYAGIDQLVEAIASKRGWHWATRKHIEEVAAQSTYRGRKRFAIKGERIKATYRITRKCPSIAIPTSKSRLPFPLKGNEWYAIIAKQSGKCLDVSSISKEKGANIIQYDYWGGDNQQWKLEPVKDGYSRIIAKHSNKCLDVGGMSMESGANIIQYDYWDGDNQQWKLEPVKDGYFRIIAKHSGKCLDAGGRRKDKSATYIRQWNCAGRDNQLWKLELASELDLRTARVWSRKGYAFAKFRRYDQAIACFDKALEISPKYTRVWRNKGYALNNLERYEDAIACFDEALKIDPNSAHVWSQKGYALLNLNKLEKAIQCFDKALEIDPKFEEAKNNEKIAKEKIRERSTMKIKRGYEVLPNNDLRFGIRIKNNTEFLIADIETLLDYPKALFSLRGNMVQTLANIPPNGERTAKYILTPLGCIHNENIDALVIYKDHFGKKHTVQMQPKEVHCVCPFLKEKAMREGEFAELAKTCESIEEGLSFSGIDVPKLTAFIKESYAHRMYVIGEHKVNDMKIVNLAGESIGEKAYYLLTAVVQSNRYVTQVAFRAYSDKPFGLQGFLNETTNSLRHLVSSVQSAQEIGIIENKQAITIIDSIVQRTSFGGEGEGKSVKIEGSVVQRTEIDSEGNA